MCTLSAAMSGISTGLGLIQSNQQAKQAQQRANLQHRNAQRQAHYERQAQVNKYLGDVRANDAQTKAYEQNLYNSSLAANKAYEAEQLKLKEAKNAAAFKAQENYIKSIQGQGKILASGMVGQSIGLLSMDAERQAGFNTAASDASMRSAEIQSAIGLGTIQTQQQSRENQYYNNLSADPTMPQLSLIPEGSDPIDLGIPDINFG